MIILHLLRTISILSCQTNTQCYFKKTTCRELCLSRCRSECNTKCHLSLCPIQGTTEAKLNQIHTPVGDGWGGFFPHNVPYSCSMLLSMVTLWGQSCANYTRLQAKSTSNPANLITNFKNYGNLHNTLRVKCCHPHNALRFHNTTEYFPGDTWKWCKCHSECGWTHLKCRLYFYAAWRYFGKCI